MAGALLAGEGGCFRHALAWAHVLLADGTLELDVLQAGQKKGWLQASDTVLEHTANQPDLLASLAPCRPWVQPSHAHQAWPQERCAHSVLRCTGIQSFMAQCS